MAKNEENRFEKAIRIFKENYGILRTSQAMKKGIHQSTLYELRDRGKIEMISIGLYRLPGAAALSNPDLITASIKVPQGIFCLITALSYHNITEQVPHHIYIAVKQRTRIPQIDYPPIRAYRFSNANFEKGVDTHTIDNQKVRIYCPERSIMDCFKYRNKIGLDVTLDALKQYIRRGNPNINLLMEYARMNRVQNIVKPYLESLI